MFRNPLVKLITAYQQILSPLFPRACRFQPSCSEYMKLAIHRHGVLRGIFLGLKRLLRCNPFFKGGIDSP